MLWGCRPLSRAAGVRAKGGVLGGGGRRQAGFGHDEREVPGPSRQSWSSGGWTIRSGARREDWAGDGDPAACFCAAGNQGRDGR